ncbi:MAG TPA: SpoIIE family protein phosphatase [Blastocatellia bacterium]|nr:SpoIIE family protein phosphatase [Blastocatellia bacterium]
MSTRAQAALAALFFAFVFVYAGARTYRAFTALGTASDTGWSLRQAGTRALISQVRSGVDDAGLQPGDEVIAIDGRQVRGNAAAASQLAQQIKPDVPYTLLVVRDGQPLQFVLRTKPLSLASIVLIEAAYIVIPTVFLITGLAVFLLRRSDKQALLMALMFGMFVGVPGALVATYPEAPAWLTGVTLLTQVVSLFFWPVFFHFFLIFPEPSPLVRRYPRIEYYLYAPHVLTIFPYLTIVNILAALAPEKTASFREAYSPFNLVSVIVMVLYIAGGLLSLVINYRQASRPSKRKMRVIVAGSLAGFVPFFLLLGSAFLVDLQKAVPGLFQWFVLLAFAAFPLFPLSFAYAIVRHQVIPVRLILRRSVRYVLIARGFIIVQAVVVFAVLSFLLTGTRIAAIDKLGVRADIVATMLATAVAIGLLTLLNQRVMPVIDRRFFRGAYDAQQVLTDLGQEMRKVKHAGHLLELAVAKIQDALHPENVTIFLRDVSTGNFNAAISSTLNEDRVRTSERASGLSMPGDGVVIERLRRSSLPLNVDRQRLKQWGFGPGDRSPATEPRSGERATMDRLRSSLLLAVATKDEVLGIISLGRRLGDLPYSREDRQLLVAVSLQMALAIQNAELVRQITEEERLQRELEIATSVQRRLFPERPPKLRRLDLSGVCHPARGVGGDYYDFIVLDADKIGIAVADVAGKGISAALLMSTIQASLRSQAPAVNGRLTELVSSMNELLHRSTDASSYATFFYAQFDEETAVLTYVNAGHNPPLLVRGSGSTRTLGVGQAAGAGFEALNAAEAQAQRVEPGVHLLTTGGPVIGAFSNCVYEQETIELRATDLLIAYTDGVTEALNAKGEEFGEGRLREIVSNSADLSAHDLSAKIVESVRAWCGDTPQHDDLTLVVMKVK